MNIPFPIICFDLDNMDYCIRAGKEYLCLCKTILNAFLFVIVLLLLNFWTLYYMSLVDWSLWYWNEIISALQRVFLKKAPASLCSFFFVYRHWWMGDVAVLCRGIQNSTQLNACTQTLFYINIVMWRGRGKATTKLSMFKNV